MRQVAIAVVLVLPLFSGCATCCDLCFDLASEMLFPGSSLTWDQQREIDEQNAIFQGYEDDRKAREESSKAWSVSALP